MRALRGQLQESGGCVRSENIDKEHMYSVNFVWLCWWPCGFLEESRRTKRIEILYIFFDIKMVGVECVWWMNGEEI